MTFQLAACAEMLWRDRPMEWRASRLKEMGFGVGLWNWPALDVDALVITKAIVNEGPKLKRWTPAAMGRATPMLKRTSHVEIIVAEAVR